jgi:Integral membrane protein CcmA involved in cell shape determination
MAQAKSGQDSSIRAFRSKERWPSPAPFRVDGHIKGNIISEHTVILGENAKVEGQIEGNRVVIAGRFDGVIFAKGRVEIQPKGVVTGEVHSPCMVVDPGGIFDGRCHMLASSDASAGVTIPIRAVGQAS